MALTGSQTGVRTRPIGATDVMRAAEFLHATLNARVPAADWAASLDVPWGTEQPNHGFMLLDGERVVGVHLAFYAEREVDGAPERFCCLGAWSVLPEYRVQGVRLLRALLAQRGHHFTDLSPSPRVVEINERLGFQHVDSSTRLVPNLPWPSRARVIADPEGIEGALSGRDLQIYRDHSRGGVARHVVLTSGDRSCYVVFRKDRRKRMSLFATLLYVSDPDAFRALASPLARHLLLDHGAVATLAERHVVDHSPRLSLRVRRPRARMFRSATLQPSQVDYLYSELTCMPW
jgi:hypothetical protein